MKTKIILLTEFFMLFYILVCSNTQLNAQVPKDEDKISGLPDLIIKDFYYYGKDSSLRVEYCNIGEASSDDKFLISIFSDRGGFSGNSSYPFSVPNPGKCALTGVLVLI